MARSENYVINMKFNGDMSHLQQQVKNVQLSLTQLTRVQTKDMGLQKQFREASQAAKEMKQHIAAATNVQTGNIDLSKLNTSLQKSKKTLTSYMNTFASAGAQGQQAFMNMAKAITAAELPMRTSNKLLDSMWTSMKNVATYQISSMIFTGFITGIRNALDYVKELDSAMNDIRVVTGMSKNEADALAKSLNKMAKNLKVSTSELAEGMLIFQQQGDAMDLAMKKAEIATKAAKVAGTEISEMTENLTALWNSFQVPEEELQRYTDILVALGAETATSFEEISTAITKVGATANAIGVDIEQLGATIATVSSVTRESAETTGVAFKTIYARMGDLQLGKSLDDGVTLGKVSSTLKTVGVDLLTVNGEMKEIGDVVEEVGGKWDTFTDAQKTALAQAMAGKRQYTQLLALFENFDEYKLNLEIAGDAEGATEEQFDIWTQRWEAASNDVKANVQDLYSSLFETDSFIKLTEGFADFVGVIDSTVDGLGGLGNILQQVGAIGLIAFKDKIAVGLSTAVANAKIYLGISQNQDLQMREELSTVLSLKAADENLNSTQRTKINNQKILTDLQIKYIKNEKTLSAEQKSTWEQGIAELQNYMKELDKVIAKRQDFEKSGTAKMLQAGAEAGNGIAITTKKGKNKTITNPEDVSRIQKDFSDNFTTKDGKITGLDNAMKALDSTEQQKIKLGQLKDANKEKDMVAKSFGKNSQQYKKAEADIKRLKKEIKELSKTGVKISVNKTSIKKSIAEIEKFQEQVENDIIEQKVKITDENGKTITTTGKQMGLTKTGVQNTVSEGANLKVEADNISQDLKEGGEDLDEKLNPDKLEKVTSGIMGIAGAAMALSTAFTSLKSIGSIWADDDISTGEKLLSTLSAVSMIAFSLTPVIMSMVTAMKLKNKEQQKDNASTLIGIGLSKLQLLAEKKEQQSSNKTFWAKVKEFIAKMIAKENWVGLAAGIGILATVGVGIGMVTSGAISKNEEEEEEQKEKPEDKIQKLTDKYEEQEKKVKEINDELKKTRDRITELSSLPSLTFVEQQELQYLKDSIDLLEQREQLEKDKARREKEKLREEQRSQNETARGKSDGEFYIGQLRSGMINSRNAEAIKNSFIEKYGIAEDKIGISSNGEIVFHDPDYEQNGMYLPELFIQYLEKDFENDMRSKQFNPKMPLNRNLSEWREAVLTYWDENANFEGFRENTDQKAQAKEASDYLFSLLESGYDIKNDPDAILQKEYEELEQIYNATNENERRYFRDRIVSTKYGKELLAEALLGNGTINESNIDKFKAGLLGLSATGAADQTNAIIEDLQRKTEGIFNDEQLNQIISSLSEKDIATFIGMEDFKQFEGKSINQIIEKLRELGIVTGQAANAFESLNNKFDGVKDKSNAVQKALDGILTDGKLTQANLNALEEKFSDDPEAQGIIAEIYQLINTGASIDKIRAKIQELGNEIEMPRDLEVTFASLDENEFKQVIAKYKLKAEELGAANAEALAYDAAAKTLADQAAATNMQITQVQDLVDKYKLSKDAVIEYYIAAIQANTKLSETEKRENIANLLGEDWVITSEKAQDYLTIQNILTDDVSKQDFQKLADAVREIGDAWAYNLLQERIFAAFNDGKANEFTFNGYTFKDKGDSWSVSQDGKEIANLSETDIKEKNALAKYLGTGETEKEEVEIRESEDAREKYNEKVEKNITENLKAELNKRKKLIAKFDSEIAVLDWGKDFLDEDNYGAQMDITAKKLDLVQQKNKALADEYEKLKNTQTSSAEAAEVVANRMEEVTKEMRDNLSLTKELHTELLTSGLDAISSIVDKQVEDYDRIYETIEKKIKKIKGLIEQEEDTISIDFFGVGEIDPFEMILNAGRDDILKKQGKKELEILEDQKEKENEIYQRSYDAQEALAAEARAEREKDIADIKSGLDDVGEKTTGITGNMAKGFDAVSSSVDNLIKKVNGFNYTNLKEFIEYLEGKEEKSGNPIIDTAASYKGTPYTWGGGHNGNYNTLDCSGYVSKVLMDLGYIHSTYTADGFKNVGTEIDKSEMQPGDLLIFDYKHDGKADHVAFYAGNGKMWHSSGGIFNTNTKLGKGVELTNFTDYYKKALVQVNRVYATGTPLGNAQAKNLGIAGENYKPEILIDKATGEKTYIDEPTVIDLTKTDVIGEKQTANLPKFAEGTIDEKKKKIIEFFQDFENEAEIDGLIKSFKNKVANKEKINTFKSNSLNNFNSFKDYTKDFKLIQNFLTGVALDSEEMIDAIILLKEKTVKKGKELAKQENPDFDSILDAWKIEGTQEEVIAAVQKRNEKVLNDLQQENTKTSLGLAMALEEGVLSEEEYNEQYNLLIGGNARKLKEIALAGQAQLAASGVTSGELWNQYEAIINNANSTLNEVNEKIQEALALPMKELKADLEMNVIKNQLDKKGTNISTMTAEALLGEGGWIEKSYEKALKVLEQDPEYQKLSDEKKAEKRAELKKDYQKSAISHGTSSLEESATAAFEKGDMKGFIQASNELKEYAKYIQEQYELTGDEDYLKEYQKAREAYENLDIDNSIKEKLSEAAQAEYDRDKKAIERLEDRYGREIEYLEEINHAMEKRYDLENSILDSERNLNKELKKSMSSAAWLDEEQRSRILNTETYARLSKELNKIREEADDLDAEYKAQIRAIKNDSSISLEEQNARIAELSAAYDHNYEMLMKGYEISKAELELTNKKQELNNVLNDKTDMMFINGAWVNVADMDKVQAAQEAVEDAKYEMDKMIREEEQAEDLWTNTSQVNTMNRETGVLNAQLEARQEKYDEMLEAFDPVIPSVVAVLSSIGEAGGDLAFLDVDTQAALGNFYQAVDTDQLTTSLESILNMPQSITKEFDKADWVNIFGQAGVTKENMNKLISILENIHSREMIHINGINLYKGDPGFDTLINIAPTLMS